MSRSSKMKLVVVGCPELTPPLKKAGFDLLIFDSGDLLLRHAREAGARACIIKPGPVPISSIGSFVRSIHKEMPFIDVIVWAPSANADTVRRALLHGIKDVVFDGNSTTLVNRLNKIIEKQKFLPRMLKHRDVPRDKLVFEGILSRNPKMYEIFDICRRTAQTDANVLILGETGTGKDLIARAFHRLSEREGRMVALNCSAVPENLIDSELFGYVRGAFTGADKEKQGLFRYAEHGTLFLDEIGHIPLPVQFRLLRVLQEGRVRPVGSDKEFPVDVRVIAATSVRLDQAVEREQFREDLLYRLDVLRLALPPLRERPEDIVFLFGHFAKKYAKHYSLTRPVIKGSFLDALQEYDWPGNVRQLENVTERLLLTASSSEQLTRDHFLTLIRPLSDESADTGTDESSIASMEDQGSSIKKVESEINLNATLLEAVDAATKRTENAYIRQALKRENGRVAKAAELLGISRRTLQRKINQLGIDKWDFRDSNYPRKN